MRKLALILAAVFLVGILTPSPSTGQSSPTSDTAPPASLMPDSIFNQVATSWPVDPSSAQQVSQFVTDYTDNYGSVAIGSRPILFVPDTQPLVPLSVQSGCSNFIGATGSEVPIPWYAESNGSSDDPLEIYQPGTNTYWEFWQAAPVLSASGNVAGWTACYGGKDTLSTSTGVMPTGGQSATAIADTATEVTDQDVLSGAIDHAIGVVIVGCNGYRYPATRGDCNSDPGQVPEGAWFRFSSSVNCASYATTVLENMICTAGKTYGFVVVDQGGAVELDVDADTEDWYLDGNPVAVGAWSNGSYEGATNPVNVAMETTPGHPSTEQQEYQVVANLPWSQMQEIDPPGYSPPTTSTTTTTTTTTTTLAITLSQSCNTSTDVDTFTWNGGSGAFYYGGTDIGSQSSGFQVQDADASVYVVVGGVKSNTLNAVCE